MHYLSKYSNLVVDLLMIRTATGKKKNHGDGYITRSTAELNLCLSRKHRLLCCFYIKKFLLGLLLSLIHSFPIKNGTRRRTPGGVYLNLLKNTPSVKEEQIKVKLSRVQVVVQSKLGGEGYSARNVTVESFS